MKKSFENIPTSIRTIFLFILLTVLIKPIWLFDYNTLNGDDLSYWLHASTLAFDFDIDYQNDYSLNLETINEKFNTPFHPPGAGYLSAPFVFIFSFFDNLKGIEFQRTSPIGSFAYAGYFFATHLYLLFGFYFLNKLFEINLIQKHKKTIFLLTLFSTLIHYSTTRFLMAHTLEFFLVSYLVYNFEKKQEFTSLDFKKSIVLFFFLAITRPSTFIISLCLLLMHRKKIFEHIKVFSNILIFAVSCLVYYLISQKLYGTSFILLDLSSNKTTESFVKFLNLQNFWDGFLNLPALFFSLSGGLIWLMPAIFFGVLSYFFNLKSKNYEYALFSFLFVFGFFVVALIWKGNEVAYGQRLFIGLLPFCAYQIGIFTSNKEKVRVLSIITIICYLHYLFFYSSDLLTLREGFSLWGTFLKYSHEDYTINLFIQLTNIENYLKIFSKTIYSILLFGTFQFENIINLFPDYLKNLENVKLFQTRAERYYDLNLNYIFIISLIYFLTTYKFIKIIDSKEV